LTRSNFLPLSANRTVGPIEEATEAESPISLVLLTALAKGSNIQENDTSQGD